MAPCSISRCWLSNLSRNSAAGSILQVKTALRLWDGSGCFVYTGSAGIYSAEDGSEVREESPTSPLGKDDRTDRCAVILFKAGITFCSKNKV